MRKKNVIGTIVFCALLLASITAVVGIMARKDSRDRFAGFYEEEKDLDVLFLGSSHMYRSVYPMELWDEYGITSYNLGASSSLQPENYWILKNALLYNKPKVVVIDTRGVNINGKTPADKNKIHEALDSMPMTKTKIQAIEDLFDTKEARREYYVPFAVYHNRWEELTASDFTKFHDTKQKGAVLSSYVASFEYVPMEDYEIQYGETVNVQYLRKMIELCQSEGIEVLMIKTPCVADAEGMAWTEAVRVLADEYGIHYLNFLKDDVDVVDYAYDFSDIQHLNVSGGTKFTNYMGAYLQETYQLEDKRTDSETAEEWDNDYTTYMQYKEELLNEQTELTFYLAMLKMRHFDTEITVVKDSEYLADEQVTAMIQNLNLEKDKIHYVENLDEEGAQLEFSVYNDRTGELVDHRYF